MTGPKFIIIIIFFFVATGIDGVSQWDSIRTGSESPRAEFVYNMDALPMFHAAIR